MNFIKVYKNWPSHYSVVNTRKLWDLLLGSRTGIWDWDLGLESGAGIWDWDLKLGSGTGIWDWNLGLGTRTIQLQQEQILNVTLSRFSYRNNLVTFHFLSRIKWFKEIVSDPVL